MDWFSFILGFIFGAFPAVVVLFIANRLNKKNVDNSGISVSLLTIEREYFKNSFNYYKSLAEVYSRNFYNEQTYRIRLEGEVKRLKEENLELEGRIQKQA